MYVLVAHMIEKKVIENIVAAPREALVFSFLSCTLRWLSSQTARKGIAEYPLGFMHLMCALALMTLKLSEAAGGCVCVLTFL